MVYVYCICDLIQVAVKLSGGRTLNYRLCYNQPVLLPAPVSPTSSESVFGANAHLMHRGCIAMQSIAERMNCECHSSLNFGKSKTLGASDFSSTISCLSLRTSANVERMINYSWAIQIRSDLANL